MKKIKATCGIGFCGAKHEEEFEFDDNITEVEMEEEIWNWAEQFLEIDWEEIEDEED